MNENLNLVEILKDCPEGTDLYSTIFGEVKFDKIEEDHKYPITFTIYSGEVTGVTLEGRLFVNYNGECTLFPSKNQRDWSKFKVKKPKFDPKTLQPFDKVLIRDSKCEDWKCDIFSHIHNEGDYNFRTIVSYYAYCIPYNEETKHLVGTVDEAPEFYRYWED